MSGAAHRGGPNRLAPRPHGEEAVGSQQRPASGRRPRKPFLERRSDPLELGGTPSDRDDRTTELSVQEFEVQDVESSDHGPVEKDRADAVERSQASDERDDPPCPVRSIDPDLGRPYGFDMLRERERDRRDGSELIVAVERAVVDADDAGVELAERPPQR